MTMTTTAGAGRGAQVELAATVERVLCAKESGPRRVWMMLKTQHGIAKGTAGWEPKPGERITLKGEWTVWNGERQLKFASMVPDIPTDPRAKLHYACEITPGLGEALEEKIWEALGEDWEKIEPGDVKGVTEARCKALRESLEYIAVNAEQVRTVSFLMAHGATFPMAEKAWDKWRQESVPIVKGDCFRLADLPHCGFRDVDTRIRAHFGIGDSDPRRTRAGVAYALRQCLEDGSTTCGWLRLRDQAVKLLGVSRAIIIDETRRMLADGLLVGWRETLALADARAHGHESAIWEFINAA
jgi:hypothetical protein